MEPAELSQLSLNITEKPLDDIRVRQAIALAVNRPELVQLARRRCQPRAAERDPARLSRLHRG